MFSTPLTGTALSERKNGNETISSVERALFRTSFPAVVNYTSADASCNLIEKVVCRCPPFYSVSRIFQSPQLRFVNTIREHSSYFLIEKLFLMVNGIIKYLIVPGELINCFKLWNSS